MHNQRVPIFFIIWKDQALLMVHRENKSQGFLITLFIAKTIYHDFWQVGMSFDEVRKHSSRWILNIIY